MIRAPIVTTPPVSITLWHGLGAQVNAWIYPLLSGAAGTAPRAPWGPGFYFTDSLAEAVTRALTHDPEFERMQADPRNAAASATLVRSTPCVVTARITLDNPLPHTYVSPMNSWRMRRVLDASKRFRNLPEHARDRYTLLFCNFSRPPRALLSVLQLAFNEFFEASETLAFLRAVHEALEVDGVIAPDATNPTDYVAWFPEQIEILSWENMEDEKP